MEWISKEIRNNTFHALSQLWHNVRKTRHQELT